MIILAIRTEKPQAEIGLYSDTRELACLSWQADRQLAETIHTKILELIHSQQLDWHDLEGILGYLGPGSFTGLRIGLTVANSLASGLLVPIVGANGNNWKADGIKRLMTDQNDNLVMPEYGAEPHITTPRR